jgi:preprotein translocase subunit YajC
LLDFLAQTPAANSPNPLISFVPLILILVVFYFLIFSAKRKQDKKRTQMIESVKKGDRIQTIGGALGTVMQVDGEEIVVKVDESTNTKIRFVRSAIHRVVTDDNKLETK